MSDVQQITMPRAQSRMRIDAAGLVIALLLLALAGLVWWDMTKLQLLSPYDVGPKAMPIATARLSSTTGEGDSSASAS